MRLIDADKIVYYESVDSDTLAGTGKFYAPRELIDAMPTIEDRKRGEWELRTYMPHHNYCTCCGADSPYNKRWKYCPVCGADMRGERDETD